MEHSSCINSECPNDCSKTVKNCTIYEALSICPDSNWPSKASYALQRQPSATDDAVEVVIVTILETCIAPLQKTTTQRQITITITVIINIIAPCVT